MALKGQGDPRWLVSQRDDGKNVNNWHWTEADWSDWIKKKLRSELEGISLETTVLWKTNWNRCKRRSLYQHKKAEDISIL